MTPRLLPDRVVRLRSALLLGLISFVAPWFTFERETDVYTWEGWGLLYMRRCSDFAHDDVECHLRPLTDRIELHFDLIPIWTCVHILTIVSIGALVTTVVMHVLERVSRQRLARVSAATLLVVAAACVAVPGDDRFRAFQPSAGLFAGALAALSALAASVDWKPRRPVMVASALFILASLWFQWTYQREAISPTNPDEQSAYSYGTFAERHHWHDIRAEREHYWGSDIRSLEPRRLARDLDTVTAIAAGSTGFVLAALLLFGALGTPARAWIIGAMVAFTGLGGTFPLLLGGSVPGPGAVLALVGVALGAWALRQRDGPETF